MKTVSKLGLITISWLIAGFAFASEEKHASGVILRLVELIKAGITTGIDLLLASGIILFISSLILYTQTKKRNIPLLYPAILMCISFAFISPVTCSDMGSRTFLTEKTKMFERLDEPHDSNDNVISGSINMNGE